MEAKQSHIINKNVAAPCFKICITIGPSLPRPWLPSCLSTLVPRAMVTTPLVTTGPQCVAAGGHSCHAPGYHATGPQSVGAGGLVTMPFVIIAVVAMSYFRPRGYGYVHLCSSVLSYHDGMQAVRLRAGHKRIGHMSGHRVRRACHAPPHYIFF